MSSNSNCEDQSIHVDFDLAMGKGSGYFRAIEKYSEENKKLLNYFREIYSRYNFATLTPSKESKIPKIVHQIWIGRRPMPEKLKAYCKGWAKMHPTWEYRLWTNAEVETYDFKLDNLSELFSRELTIGERVDILRYDILYRYGGIYADCDNICLKSFDPFVSRYDFFGGLYQPVFPTVERTVFLQNGLFGAKPLHPILLNVANLLYEGWDKVGQGKDEFYNTIQRTFWKLTEAFVAGANVDGNIDIAMPAAYFLPIYQGRLLDLLIRGPVDIILGVVDHRRSPFSRIRDFSFTHHESDKEWMHDIYDTFSFSHLGWTLFNKSHWQKLFKAKLTANNAGVKGRQKFSEIVEESRQKNQNT